MMLLQEAHLYHVLCTCQVSDAEWEQLRDADFSAAASLAALPLTEHWIVSALHAVCKVFSSRCQHMSLLLPGRTTRTTQP